MDNECIERLQYYGTPPQEIEARLKQLRRGLILRPLLWGLGLGILGAALARARGFPKLLGLTPRCHDRDEITALKTLRGDYPEYGTGLTGPAPS